MITHYTFMGDTHFGAGNGADDFGGPERDMAFYRLTADLKDAGHKLVDMGDYAELGQTTEDEIVKAHPLGILAFQQNFSVHLKGNHDDVPELFGEPLLDEWEENSIYAEHGRRFDPYSHGLIHSVLSKPAVAVVSWLERHIHPDVDLWLERCLSRGRYSTIKAYRKAGLTILQDRDDLRVVVFGHTHKVAVSKVLDGCYVLNSGTWIGGRHDAVTVNADTLECSVLHFRL